MKTEEEIKPKWVIEYDSDADVLQIYLLNDLTDSIDVKAEITLEVEYNKIPEDWDYDWEKLIRKEYPTQWAMAERIATMLETGFYKPLDPKEFKITELMDGEFCISTERGHEFILSWPDGEGRDIALPEHVEIYIQVNAVSLGLAPLRNGKRRPNTGDLNTFISLLRGRLKNNRIPQDIELIEFLSTLEDFSYHLRPDDECWDVTIWLPKKVFQEHFGHLDLEM
ncbi:hypothetical protein [Flavobacterium sp.]|jgi:hypothetical protein|uniref:hypothetical protein n=1 Tax=Flavobacterium sp. TaxID=239 RepID=UPI0037BE8610